MIYIFDERAGGELLEIKGETFKYLIKVRRHTVGDRLSFRSQERPQILHTYKLLSVEPRSATLALESSEEKVVKSEAELHIGWCIIDAKSVEKVLPSLCEMGVSKISFIACRRSQKNFKVDLKRYERIVEASMQQSGRSTFMEFALYKNLESFLQEHEDVKVFDFCDKILEDGKGFTTVLIGCEGGFSPEERELLAAQEVFRLKSPMVLRSESAVAAVAAKILL